MSIAAMTAIVLILLTLTGVLRHTVEETGIKNTHVIYWLICVICLKAFLLNPTPEIELNFGLVPIIIGPAVFAAAKGTANRVIPFAFVFGIVYMLINFSVQNPETANYLYGSVILTAALIFGDAAIFPHLHAQRFSHLYSEGWQNLRLNIPALGTERCSCQRKSVMRR